MIVKKILNYIKSREDKIIRLYENGWYRVAEAKLDGNFEVPLPVGYENFSGKFIVRIPKSLHYKLSVEAEQEGVSLNQYALYKLSR